MAIYNLAVWDGTPDKPTMETTPFAADLHKLYLKEIVTTGGTFTFGIDANAASYSVAANTLGVMGNAGQSVVVNWGDSSTTNVTFTGAMQYITHTYANGGAQEFVCTITGSLMYLQSFYANTCRLILNFANIPSTLKTLLINNVVTNKVTGNFGNIPSGLTTLTIDSTTGISAALSGLPSTLTYVTLGNLGTGITGAIQDVPTGLTTLQLWGLANVTGTLNSLPTGLQYLYLILSTAITGSIENLSSNLIGLTISSTPSANTNITGSVDNLTTSSLVQLSLYQLTNVTCNISLLATDQASLQQLNLYGISQTVGTFNLTNLPSALWYCSVDGTQGAVSYTTGRSWAANMNQFRFLPNNGYGLSSTSVDNLLIDFANTSWSSGTIKLDGFNSARTAASNTAVTTLQGMGVTVTTN